MKITSDQTLIDRFIIHNLIMNNLLRPFSFVYPCDVLCYVVCRRSLVKVSAGKCIYILEEKVERKNEDKNLIMQLATDSAARGFRGDCGVQARSR